jgi:hypothetical protein
LEQMSKPESIYTWKQVEWCWKLPGLVSEYHDLSSTSS